MTFFNEEDELEAIPGQEDDQENKNTEIARQDLELKEKEAEIEAEAEEIETQRRAAEELSIEEEKVLNEQSQGAQDMDEMMGQATGTVEGGLADIPGVQDVIDALANAASQGDVSTNVAEVAGTKDAGVKGKVEEINDGSAEQGT